MSRALISVRARARCAVVTATFIAAVRSKNQLAMISHLGAMIPVLVGKLLAKRMKGEKGFRWPNDNW